MGACQNCHQKIDPWGIPLENLDATGAWRDALSSSEDSDGDDHEIDATTSLPSGKTIQGAVELKRWLREEYAEDFTLAMVRHMYSCNRSCQLR